MRRRLKKTAAAALCLLIWLFGATTCMAENEAEEKRPNENTLFAKSAVLMDADSGRVLYEKNGNEAMANASTTKIMTCILALENCEEDAAVPVSSQAAAAPKVHLGMHEGQQFYLRDLLFGLMLESFNDCAVAIAEFVGGNVESFAAMMNHKAEEIGCKDTHFITPNGLDAADESSFHHTTATDLALIMRYCITQSPKADRFLAITRTPNYSFNEIQKGTSYSCVNHNAFLQMMDGALSGKTGFTGNAGYCYVGALTRDGRTYIVALLACGWPNNKNYKWADTKKLMQYGIDSFYKANINEVELDASLLKHIPVTDGQGRFIGDETYVDLELVRKGEAEELLLPNGEEFKTEYRIAPRLTAPVEAGDYVGSITISAQGETVREYEVRTKTAVKKIDFKWCFRRILELTSLF